MRTCSTEDCARPHYARGWCKTHYNRWWDTLHADDEGRPCEIEGCSRPVHGHGWCETHYRRWSRHGDPHWVPAPAEERFWSYADQTGDCWLWTAGLSVEGYGQFKANRRGHAAHRFAYEMLVGPIPEGMELDHLCHTEAVKRGECRGGATCLHRRCVNPAHLEPVTNAENIRRGLTGKHQRRAA